MVLSFKPCITVMDSFQAVFGTWVERAQQVIFSLLPVSFLSSTLPVEMIFIIIRLKCKNGIAESADHYDLVSTRFQGFNFTTFLLWSDGRGEEGTFREREIETDPGNSEQSSSSERQIREMCKHVVVRPGHLASRASQESLEEVGFSFFFSVVFDNLGKETTNKWWKTLLLAPVSVLVKTLARQGILYWRYSARSWFLLAKNAVCKYSWVPAMYHPV